MLQLLVPLHRPRPIRSSRPAGEVCFAREFMESRRGGSSYIGPRRPAPAQAVMLLRSWLESRLRDGFPMNVGRYGFPMNGPRTPAPGPFVFGLREGEDSLMRREL